MVHRTCKLCHAKRDLQDSHYLPRGIYKRTRADQLTNSHPVLLSAGRARQSSLQVRDYKFCAECEKRFNRGGEAWILKNVPQQYGDKFQPQETLKNATPRVLRNGFALYPQSLVPSIEVKKLTYFAVSMFWRGTLRWSPVDGGRPERIHLGRYERSIRHFLLGRCGLPHGVVITVAVWPFERSVPLAALTPVMSTGTPYRRYWFYFSGFIFVLAVGRRIPDEVYETCAYHSAENVVTVSIEIGQSVWNVLKARALSVDSAPLTNMLKEIGEIKAKLLYKVPFENRAEFEGTVSMEGGVVAASRYVKIE